MKIDFEEGKIHYQVSGKGSALIFLHGFMETAQIWRAFQTEFSMRFSTIAIDLPGHGESSVFSEIHTMDFMAKAVNAVLKAENVSRAIFIGHSMGGYVTMALADLFPEKIHSVVLFSSSCFADTEEKKKDRDKAITTAEASKQKFVSATIPNLFYQKEGLVAENNIRKMTNMGIDQPLKGITAAIAGMRDRPDRSHILKNIKSSMLLLLGGKNDTLVTPEAVSKMAEIAPHAEVILMDECGHNGYIEKEKESLAAISDFLIGSLLTLP